MHHTWAQFSKPRDNFSKCWSGSTPRHKANNLTHRLPNIQNISSSFCQCAFLNASLDLITDKYEHFLAFRVEEKAAQMDGKASLIVQSNEQSHSKKIFLLSIAFPTEGKKKKIEANPTIIPTPMNHCHHIWEKASSNWCCRSRREGGHATEGLLRSH